MCESLYESLVCWVKTSVSRFCTTCCYFLFSWRGNHQNPSPPTMSCTLSVGTCVMLGGCVTPGLANATIRTDLNPDGVDAHKSFLFFAAPFTPPPHRVCSDTSHHHHDYRAHTFCTAYRREPFYHCASSTAYLRTSLAFPCYRTPPGDVPVPHRNGR